MIRPHALLLFVMMTPLPASAATIVTPPTKPVDAALLGIPVPIADPGGRALEGFYRGLRRAEAQEGKARIVVWGASHMAGDLFTKVIRHRLQGTFGDAGPGFIVPGPPWRDYNHRDLNISFSKDRWDPYWVSKNHKREDGLYGLAGASFSSRDRRAWSEVETARKSLFGRLASSVELFYWKHKRAGDLWVTIDGERRKKVRMKSKRPGPGYTRFDLEDDRHVVKLQPRGNGRVHLFGMALERDVPGVVMDVMGINGARLSAQLSWDPALFAEHLRRRAPDLVILAYGTNAAGDKRDPITAYERRIERAVLRVRATVPGASCLLIGPSDRPERVSRPDGKPWPEDEAQQFFARARQPQLIAAQKRVALRNGCGYWDMAAAMGGSLSMLRWVHSEPRLAARDYIHLTRAGYERLGGLFHQALMAGYSSAPPAP
ncbi:MAG: GDSL-type esterase/lipase family protein [Myxococcota bacterium]